MSQTNLLFKPGDEVPQSGIYKVTHDYAHTQPHDVTCVYGKKFPPCRGCAHPRFVLKQAAVHIELDDWFSRNEPVAPTFGQLFALRYLR